MIFKYIKIPLISLGYQRTIVNTMSLYLRLYKLIWLAPIKDCADVYKQCVALAPKNKYRRTLLNYLKPTFEHLYDEKKKIRDCKGGSVYDADYGELRY